MWTAAQSRRSRGAPSQPLTPSQRIAKAAERLAGHPRALDVLYTSLSRARDNPHSEKFRKVNIENAVFKATVGGAPGGTEILYACGYEPMFGHLVLQCRNEALLNEALDALDTVRRDSETYREASKASKAEVEAAARKQAEAADRAKKRADHLALVPKEPHGATSRVVINVKDSAGEKIAQRVFDSEATLRDLLHFVRSLDRVPDPEASLRLENVTTAPAALLNTEANLDRSLYSLDLWPVSHVRVEVCAAA